MTRGRQTTGRRPSTTGSWMSSNRRATRRRVQRALSADATLVLVRAGLDPRKPRPLDRARPFRSPPGELRSSTANAERRAPNRRRRRDCRGRILKITGPPQSRPTRNPAALLVLRVDDRRGRRVVESRASVTTLMRRLQQLGYRVIPVNPNETEVLGRRRTRRSPTSRFHRHRRRLPARGIHARDCRRRRQGCARRRCGCRRAWNEEAAARAESGRTDGGHGRLHRRDALRCCRVPLKERPLRRFRFRAA